MENDGLDELFAAESPSAVEDAATDADAPDAGFPPTESPDAVVTPEVAADASPVVAAAPEPEPVVPAQAPAPEAAKPQIDWDHPELQAIKADAEAMRGLKSRVEEARRLKEQTDFQNEVNEFVDGDSEQLQRFNQLTARQTEPLRRQVEAYEQRIDSTERNFAAFIVALKATLPEDQFNLVRSEYESVVSIDGGPEAMERAAFGKRDFLQQHSQALSAKDSEIADLKAQLAAKNELAAREASGADRVDGGGGMPLSSNDRKSRMENAKTDDEYFDALFGNTPLDAPRQSQAA